MTTTITATQAKAELLAIIDRVANGTSGPVIVTKHGKARVKIVPVVDEGNSISPKIGYGALRGQAIPLQGYDYARPILDDETSGDFENIAV